MLKTEVGTKRVIVGMVGPRYTGKWSRYQGGPDAKWEDELGGLRMGDQIKDPALEGHHGRGNRQNTRGIPRFSASAQNDDLGGFFALIALLEFALYKRQSGKKKSAASSLRRACTLLMGVKCLGESFAPGCGEIFDLEGAAG